MWDKLSRVHPESGAWPSPNVLQKSPFARRVATVVSLWAFCDVELLLLLTGFLKADYRIVAEMLNVVTSGEAKMAMLKAAAATRLRKRPKDLKLFDNVIDKVRDYKNTRNNMVHHLWGWAGKLDETKHLILASPSALIAFELDKRSYESSKKPTKVPAQIDTSNVRVARNTEFQTAENDSRRAIEMVRLLRKCLFGPRASRTQARVQLCRLLPVAPKDQVKSTRKAH